VLPVLHEAAELAENELPPEILDAKVEIFFLSAAWPYGPSYAYRSSAADQHFERLPTLAAYEFEHWHRWTLQGFGGMVAAIPIRCRSSEKVTRTFYHPFQNRFK
jgi:hypothetical protein